MARSFTSIEVQGGVKTETKYTGFSPTLLPLSELDRVAIVSVEDTFDIYALDEGSKPLLELIRYLDDRGEDVKIAGVYKRDKS